MIRCIAAYCIVQKYDTLTTLSVKAYLECCAVLWCGVLCCGVLWYAVLWCAVVCYAVVCCAVLCCGVLCCAVVWCAMQWCAVVWCAVVWCGVVWCGVVCCALFSHLLRSTQRTKCWSSTRLHRPLPPHPFLRAPLPSQPPLSVASCYCKCQIERQRVVKGEKG